MTYSAIGFLTFMSGSVFFLSTFADSHPHISPRYTVFLGPFAAIMICDYWIVHRGAVDVPAMYDPYGRYRYWKGFNWRAVLAIAISVPPNMPGLISSINPKIDVGGGAYVFNFAWIFGVRPRFLIRFDQASHFA